MGVEQQMAQQLPGLVFGQGAGMVGAFEVEQQAVDDQVGARADVDAGEGWATGAFSWAGAGAQGLERAVGGLVELGDDVGHQVTTRPNEQPWTTWWSSATRSSTAATRESR
ncbi:hypothetical protein [Streptomyces sp. BE133]|uniref:hypothetical protein n=1 Tax=Streptomyces sp. BE133 TaxID=3002523 RepID=UPI002E774DBF|nr:hypothetical protein [Streptomyces sp. BE133]MEE1805105.1 hypothetical protein [Streptomyces sp. BE133]